MTVIRPPDVAYTPAPNKKTTKKMKEKMSHFRNIPLPHFLDLSLSATCQLGLP